MVILLLWMITGLPQGFRPVLWLWLLAGQHLFWSWKYGSLSNHCFLLFLFFRLMSLRPRRRQIFCWQWVGFFTCMCPFLNAYSIFRRFSLALCCFLSDVVADGCPSPVLPAGSPVSVRTGRVSTKAEWRGNYFCFVTSLFRLKWHFVTETVCAWVINK